MDFIEINKLTQNKRVNRSRDNLYNLSKLSSEDSVVLICYACKKLYGVGCTAKILHGLGIKDLKV